MKIAIILLIFLAVKNLYENKYEKFIYSISAIAILIGVRYTLKIPY